MGNSILPFLESMLQDSDESLRAAAANTLGELGSKSATEAIIRVLQDENENVRSAFVQALGELANEKAIPHLATSLDDIDENVRNNAAYALLPFGSIVAPIFIANLKNDKRDVRELSAYMLGKIKDVSAVPYLVSSLNEPDGNVRRVIIDALGMLEDSSVTLNLISLLTELDRETNYHVVLALGHSGSSIALTRLGELRNFYEQLNDVQLLGLIDDSSTRITKRLNVDS